MSPQRRTALVSVVAACVLISLKLATGLASGSLGLVSEAVHSGTDLVAALLTLFAVGVSGRPADRGHPYGHGKAEHLAALAEAGILVLASLYISYRSLAVLVGSAESNVEPGLVHVRRRPDRDRRGRESGDRVASRLAPLPQSRARLERAPLRQRPRRLDRRSVRAPARPRRLAGGRCGRGALRRGARPDRGLQAHARQRRRAHGSRAGRRRAGCARGDRADWSRACSSAVCACARLPGATSRTSSSASRRMRASVRVMPPRTPSRPPCRALCPRATSSSTSSLRPEDAALRERILAAALTVPRVREMHNIRVVSVDDGLQVALHLKLPQDLTLETAHEVASQVERAISDAVPEVVSVQTHLEPLREPAAGRAPAGANVEADAERIRRIVAGRTGAPPREVRFLQTEDGLVAFLTLGPRSGVHAGRRARARERGRGRRTPRPPRARGR